MLARVLAAPFTLDNPASQQTRRLGVLAVLSWLQTHPGDSWQQRWQASGARRPARLAGPDRHRPRAQARLPHLSPGLLVLICADVIRPSLDWLLRFAPARRGLAAEMARTRDPAAFAALAELCTQGGVGLQTGQQALTRVAVILAAKGGPVAAVRVGDCVELLQPPPQACAPPPTYTPTARCSTNCCAPTASSAPTRPPRSRCSPAAGSPPASS